tara:strand:+ start:61 stop:432 length:372 start_codon:yes stop_codon:yes gene_type:complete
MSAANVIYWSALAIAIGSNVGANLALKVAMSSLGDADSGPFLLRVMQQVSFWVGLVLAGVLLISYLFAIRHIPVSIAYISVTSLAMVGLLIADLIWFGHPATLSKFFGVCLVIGGVWLISRPV